MRKSLIIGGILIILLATKIALFKYDGFIDPSTISLAWDIRVVGVLIFILGLSIKNENKEGVL